MTSDQISQLVQSRAVPHPTKMLRLIETHISWVLLGDHFVYKIKKPRTLSFLDFTDLEARRRNSLQESHLNRRLAPDMYLGVLPVVDTPDGPKILIGEDEGSMGGDEGSTGGSNPSTVAVSEPDNGVPESNNGVSETSSMSVDNAVIIDYAVWMRRMDETRQLDVLLERDEVHPRSMADLAHILAVFHRNAPVISEAEDWEAIFEEFRDLQTVTATLADILDAGDGDRIRMVIANSWNFLRGHADRIEQRKASGFVRDGHGDLHCRNVMMTRPPVVFDCIEFSESLRTLDVLSETGFLCMDLERYGRPDLSAAFFQAYQNEFPCIENDADRQLFVFYKMYRANVRMKVETLALDHNGTNTPKPDPGLVFRLKGYARVFFAYAEELQLLGG